MHHPQAYLSGMIEIYTQNSGDTWFAVALNQQKIVTSTFSPTQKTTIQNILGNIPFNLPFQVFHEPSTTAKNALSALKSIYDGQETKVELALASSYLPAYSKKVLKATSAIPVGYVATYGGIARAVGGGPRAVGNIMAGNPFAPIVPCHRVVNSDFTLGGYGGGLKVKMELLRKEQRGFFQPKQIAAEGGALSLFPVEYVLSRFA
jgi:O-6-methylguanine DNA methyltransferase